MEAAWYDSPGYKGDPSPPYGQRQVHWRACLRQGFAPKQRRLRNRNPLKEQSANRERIVWGSVGFACEAT